MCVIIRDNGVFGLNVLRAEQSDISDSFSGRLTDPDANPLVCTDLETSVCGAPGMSNALINLDCSIKN